MPHRLARLRRTSVALALPLVVGATFASPAHAGGGEACSYLLEDSADRIWETNEYADFWDVDLDDPDRNTLYSEPYYDREFDEYPYYIGEGQACTVSDDGQTVTYPSNGQDPGLPIGVEYSAEMHVPAAGRPFLRQLHRLHNTSDETRYADLFFYQYSYADGNTDWRESSDGNATGSTGDSWITFTGPAGAEGARGSARGGGTRFSGQAGAFVWQGGDDRRRETASVYDLSDYEGGVNRDARGEGDTVAVQDGDYEPQAAFESIPIRPGETAVIAQFAVVDPDVEDASETAAWLAGGPEAAWVGMSEDERRAVRNFAIGTPERDDDDDDSDDDADEAPAPAPEAVVEAPPVADPLSFTALFGTQSSTTASRSGLFMAPGMTETCGVGACRVFERAYTAKQAEQASHDNDKRHGLLARDDDTLAAGQSNPVRLRLTPAANRKLTREGSIEVETLVTITDAKGRSQLVRKTFTVERAD